VAWSSVPRVPARQVDAYGIDLDRARSLAPGVRAESVVAILGEPTDRQRSCVPGQIEWRYAIRAWNDAVQQRRVVPAAILRVTFDHADTLTDWAFVDPFTGRSLPILETQDEAARWYRALAHAPPPRPPRIVLRETLVRGQATQRDVQRELGQWQPDIYCSRGGPVPVVRKETTDSGSVWDWFADRPSPLFIPPWYLVASFDTTGRLIVWHIEQTYPGGRK
jgi:hypothetical protein